MDPTAAQLILMYFRAAGVADAGFADYLCTARALSRAPADRKSPCSICFQFAGNGRADARRDLSEINALVILIMIICLLLHEATRSGMSATLRDAYRNADRGSTFTASRNASSDGLCSSSSAALAAVSCAVSPFGGETAQFGLRIKEVPAIRRVYHGHAFASFCCLRSALPGRTRARYAFARHQGRNEAPILIVVEATRVRGIASSAPSCRRRPSAPAAYNRFDFDERRRLPGFSDGSMRRSRKPPSST